MWKGNPAVAGLLTLLDCPYDTSTWNAMGGNCRLFICMLCGVWIKLLTYLLIYSTVSTLAWYDWKIQLESVSSQQSFLKQILTI